MSTRTDQHRKGAIIPAEYRHVLSYNLATSCDGWPVPSYGINCELDRRKEHRDADGRNHFTNGEHSEDGRCCWIGLLHRARVRVAAHGSPGKCTVCGAHFVYGDVWEHIPTGEHIHIGHDCADKYELLADRSAHELALGRLKAAAAVQVQRVQNAERRLAFLSKHPGLAEALEGSHSILKDLAYRLQRYDLSEKQVALALKIDAELRNPRPEEANVPAPVTGGRQTVEGEVVGLKTQESAYGEQLKVTIKVRTDGGVWLAWGTCPAALRCERGDVVRLTATLRAGREPHFAIMGRPTGGVVVSRAAASAVRQ